LVRRGGAVVIPVRRTGTQQGSGSIGGRVTDVATRAPLDRVAVRIEGLGSGTVSAADGHYAIRNVPSGTYHVTARRVGYLPLTTDVTLTTDQPATLDFALAVAPTKLDEVVTTAVGEQRRYEVGNVIATINADSIARTAPITDLTDLLSARAPNVQVLQSSGMAGDGPKIRIRGLGSFTLQNDPIVYVDGVRVDNYSGGLNDVFRVVGPRPTPSRLNDLDPEDIASIDVLKGPSAATEMGRTPPTVSSSSRPSEGARGRRVGMSRPTRVSAPSRRVSRQTTTAGGIRSTARERPWHAPS
jgi:hypothetical protein